MAITLLNQTAYPAAFQMHKGGLVLAVLPAIEPGAELVVSAESVSYEITAEIILNGKRLTSAPVAFGAGNNVRLLAQVTQQLPEQAYVFNVIPVYPSELGQLQLASTCGSDVLFRISSQGHVMQTVLVNDPFVVVNLALDDIYSFSAVIDGITVGALTTSNGNASITAVTAKSSPDGEFFELQLS
jgi:hypothetical protein